MESLFKNHIGPLLIIFIVGLALANVVIAKEYSVADIDKAAFANDMAMLENAWKNGTARVKYVAGYRWVTMKMFAQRDIEGGKPVLNELIAYLESELAQARKNGEAWAVLATLRGVQIFTTPEYASVYGPKVGLEMALATDYGKDHPVVYMLQGMNLYNTPEQYGGSKERALTALDRAIELYEEAEQGEHWGMMDALSWRGQAHLALGNKEAARKDFQKALTLSPQNAWVQGLLASMN